jgi:hypothetical protein
MRQSGRMQYTGPVVETQHWWGWRHSGQATREIGQVLLRWRHSCHQHAAPAGT